MDCAATCLKTFPFTGPIRFHFPLKPTLSRCYPARFFCGFNSPHVNRSLHFPHSSTAISPLCTLSNIVVGSKSQNENGDSWILEGAGNAVSEACRDNNILQVVLVSPQIPGNTGSIARTCAATAVGLHLIEPLGFEVDSTKLKRAGLDFWPYVVVKIHSSWAEFREYFLQQEGEKRLLAFTKRGTKVHSDFSYRKGDFLVFGSETSGLPTEALQDCNIEPYGGGLIRIPMVETYVRCLNLAVSAGIALYEASRQLNYEQLQIASESCKHAQYAPSTEDIFG